MKDKDCEYCNYCKYFENRIDIVSRKSGICYHNPHPRPWNVPAFPEFYSRTCPNFSYSLIRNAFGIPELSLDEWKDAYEIRSNLRFALVMNSLNKK